MGTQVIHRRQLGDFLKEVPAPLGIDEPLYNDMSMSTIHSLNLGNKHTTKLAYKEVLTACISRLFGNTEYVATVMKAVDQMHILRRVSLKKSRNQIMDNNEAA